MTRPSVLSHPLGMMIPMGDIWDERIAGLDGEVTALERSLAEIERRSKACQEAAAWNWGGRPDEPANPDASRRG